MEIEEFQGHIMIMLGCLVRIEAINSCFMMRESRLPVTKLYIITLKFKRNS